MFNIHLISLKLVNYFKRYAKKENISIGIISNKMNIHIYLKHKKQKHVYGKKSKTLLICNKKLFYKQNLIDILKIFKINFYYKLDHLIKCLLHINMDKIKNFKNKL